MHPLTVAITAKWTGTVAITTAIPGGLSLDAAPDGAAMPHMVYQVIGTPIDEMFGNSKRYEATIAFTLFYGIDLTAAMTAMKAFTDVFDDVILTLSSGTHFDTFRLDEPSSQRVVDDKGLPAFDKNGVPISQVICHYRFSVAL